jgi:hypothetical protein
MVLNKSALLDEYVHQLQRRIGTDYFCMTLIEQEDLNPRVIATKMFSAIDKSIKRGSRSDYLNHNPALRDACKKFGIKTSPEFREAWLTGTDIGKARKIKSSKRPVKNPTTKRTFKFSKNIIATDIENYLIKKKLIDKRATIVIPEGGYHYEPHTANDVLWDGTFEVFDSDMKNIIGYGRFGASVPIGCTSEDNYRLAITYKGKLMWVFE